MPLAQRMFRLRTNKKVGERNAIIQHTGSDSTPIQETWVWYAKTLVCTHAGKYKSRGKGKRARQESRSIECPAQKTATCITVQTKHMRYLYDRFPEVVLIDTTHGTNAQSTKSSLS
ncbi:hypothetical protein F441_17524 [Phytophthora nicotianae CJ01A1]|uniref:ZSWIM1/3 RNaseH-like domain-containing protein n=6 Tax=Phytophthora nicotianae TaxID=4792 RepID=V9EAM5_PHYNI|nr:hypothetical protein F443_17657 [Phytophthora nicotianae P1569]ETL29836.1 hypothetical protein L916_17085 [Phytophthora nicotianae]ETP05993.1 hypothetical protein F441_17524 [Phytophthora nicotianae CJ01A1]